MASIPIGFGENFAGASSAGAVIIRRAAVLIDHAQIAVELAFILSLVVIGIPSGVCGDDAEMRHLKTAVSVLSNLEKTGEFFFGGDADEIAGTLCIHPRGKGAYERRIFSCRSAARSTSRR